MIRKMHGMILAMSDDADGEQAGRSQKSLDRVGGLRSRERADCVPDRAVIQRVLTVTHSLTSIGGIAGLGFSCTETQQSQPSKLVIF
jgi:hypothetical protein